MGACEKLCYSITELAKEEHMTRQAIRLAITSNSLKAKKYLGKWWININDVAEWKREKYSRKKRVIDGRRIFDNEHLDVRTCAKLKNTTTEKIYYMIYKGVLKTQWIGSQYVINREDLENLNLKVIKSYKKEAS